MTTDDLDQVLNFLYEKVPVLQSRESIARFVSASNKSELVLELLNYLEAKKYIYQQLPPDEQDATLSPAQYSLTVRGIQFYQTAAVGGRPFYSRELVKQDQQKTKTAVDQLQSKSNQKSHSLLEQLVYFFSGKRMHHAT